MIKLNHLTYKYSGGAKLFSQAPLNLEIAGKGITLIEGANGSGKSTLIKLILGELPCPKKDMLDFSDLKSEEIAYLAQSEHLAPKNPFTVRDALFLGNPQAYRKRLSMKYALVNLKRCGLEKKLLSTRLYELSGGQRKRVFIARALMASTRLLVLDEPFANLDSKTVKDLVILFKQFTTKGPAVLLSAHQLANELDLKPDKIIQL